MNKEFAILPINYSSNLPKYGGRNETWTRKPNISTDRLAICSNTNYGILPTSKINYKLTLEVGLVFFSEYKKLAKNNGLSFTF